MSENDIEKKVAHVMRQHLEYLETWMEEEFENASRLCESPIEKLMLMRLMTVSSGYGWPRPWNRIILPDQDVARAVGRLQEFEIAIVPQNEIGRYRVDFMLFLAVPTPQNSLRIARFVVECDGHEFHEKTKKQAARDKARDRFLVGRTFQVFRYTGSEIFRNDDDLLIDLERALTESYDHLSGLGR